MNKQARHRRRARWAYRTVFLALAALAGCRESGSYDIQVPAAIRPAVQTYRLSKIPNGDLLKPEINRALIQLSEQACDRTAMGTLAAQLDLLGFHADAGRVLVQFVEHCGRADGFLSAAADDFIATGDFKQAIDLLNRLLANDPLNAQFTFDRGRALESAERYDEALSDYMQVLALESDRAALSGNLFIRAAEIHARAGRYCDAIGMIRMWTSASPDRADNPQAKSMIARYASTQTCPSSYASGQATFARRTGSTIKVRVTINGTEGTFIVDTGASYVGLTSGFAQRASIHTDHAKVIHMQTANGARDAKLTQADTIALNGVTASNVPVTVDNTGGASFGAGIDGLLGQSFLSRFDVRFAPNQWSIAQR
ncbi:retroviral-like aspartic protease family protein [Caballeronia sp. INDeC2]|uniref:retroviral-like aspartic protease family protein n=1 Tax=Caballeronia sp. INDeC2 TaxID=2921747 RepID=UPI0020288A11|nr:retroviral-like aspartic protease family protein [Caballeronia sp. INDeC2]